MPVRRHCAVFELMVEEVARNASAVAQNTAAAKKSASDASTSAREAATHAADAADSARAASTSAGQAASSAQSASSSAGTASTKATEASKVLPLQSPQKRGGHQCRCGENVRNECGSVRTISRHFCIHRDHESVRSSHFSTGCVGFKRGGKIIRNERSLERQ